MERVWDVIGFASVAVTAVLSLLFIQNLGSTQTSLRPPQVASATNIRFSETPDLPSPNQVLELVNQERGQRGLKPLLANQDLESIAKERVADMINNTYYSHVNPIGRYYYDLMRSSGLQTEYSCENLDLSFDPQPKRYIEDWMGSNKGHRACILNASLQEAGYAVGVINIPTGNSPTSFVIVAIHATSVSAAR